MSKIEVPPPGHVVRVEKDCRPKSFAECTSRTATRLKAHVENLDPANLFQNSQERLARAFPQPISSSEMVGELLGLRISESICMTGRNRKYRLLHFLAYLFESRGTAPPARKS